MLLTDLDQLIRDIPDFPKPGITFKDITPLLADAHALQHSCAELAAPFKDQAIDQVIGIESRGFIFAPLVASHLNCGFVPVRKPGKLPWRCKSISYDLEYGQDTLEIHEDALKTGDRVLIIDDVLATGGTMCAATELAQSLGAEVVSAAFLLSITCLKGADKLSCPHHSLLNY